MLGILFIIGLSILIALNLKKYSISEIIPCVFISIIVFLYPFYFVNRLRWGRCGIIIIFFVLLFYSVYRLSFEKSLYINHLNPIPVLGYLSILFVIILITKDNYVWLWDSTRLWGAVPKALYYTERLQLGPNALVYPFMQSYPPGMPLLAYFVESFNTDFSEWQIYLTYGAFVTSLFLPGIRAINKKNLRYLPFFCLLILVIPCIATSNGNDYSYFYNSLFIDSVLGALFGYGIYISSETNYSDFLSVCRLMIVLFSLTMLKDSGALFAVTLFILSIILYCQKKHFSEKKELVLSLLTLLSVLVPWRSWALLIKSYNIINQTGGLQYRLSLTIIQKLLTNSVTVPSIQYNSRGNAFCISFSFVIVLLLELLASYYILNKIKRFDRKRFVSTTLTLFLSYLVFLIGYGLTYGNWDPIPSFLRYTTTLTIAPMIYMYIILTDYYFTSSQLFFKKSNVSSSIILLVSCIVMIDTLFIWEKETNQSHICPYDSVKKQSDFIINTIYADMGINTLDPDRNINLYLMYTGNAGDNCIESQRLYMNLIGSGIREKNNYLDMQIINWDYYNEDPSYIDPQEAVRLWNDDIINGYDYVYVYDIDSRTNAILLENISVKLEKNHIYRIDKDQNLFIDLCNLVEP